MRKIVPRNWNYFFIFHLTKYTQNIYNVFMIYNTRIHKVFDWIHNIIKGRKYEKK